ncbi:hypothetical protein J6590_001525 [Homalodisca vitripennis]|nr:hypothetical protein J6590_001525 [Homalodisca vitripennis]
MVTFEVDKRQKNVLWGAEMIYRGVVGYRRSRWRRSACFCPVEVLPRLACECGSDMIDQTSVTGPLPPWPVSRARALRKHACHLARVRYHVDGGGGVE